MQLPDDTDAGAALAIDRDHRFDGDLVRVGDVDKAGVDGPGGHRAGRSGVRDRRLHRCFDDRDQPVDEIGQTEIDHGGFQIGHAVLDRTRPN